MITRAAMAACALALVVAGEASAGSPTPGAAKGAFTADQEVRYTYGGTVPSWLVTAVDDSLENRYHDADDHNSHAPTLAHFGSASAKVYYWNASASPCTGSLDWLACTQNGLTTSWTVKIRNLDSAPHGSWAWWDDSPHCSGTGCFYIERAMIHESGHAMLGFDDVSGWSENNTVMNGTDPHHGLPEAMHWTYRRCDEAASQLVWDVKTSAGPYGDCFALISGHGDHGLVTQITMGTTSYVACTGQAVSVAGRLQVEDLASYGPLGGNPLTTRTVEIDRGSTVDYTSTTASNANGNNWSVTFSSGSVATYSYTAHFDYTSGSGLDPSNSQSFTISWRSSC